MNLESAFATEIVKGAQWSIRPLGVVVDILDSKRKPITKRDRVAGPYPYYGATGVLDWVQAYIFDEPLVLIGEDGAKWGAGDASAFPVSGKVWVNNHAHVLRPDRERLLDEWLIYYLNAVDLGEFISGMTVPKLNQGRLREIPVPLPPLEEQKRIVAVLDEAFAALDRARALADANLADAEELFERELAGAFARAEGFAKPRAFEKLCKALTPKTKIMRKDYLEEGCHPIVSQEADLISGYWNDESALMGLDEPVVVFGDHTRCLKYVDFDFVVGADGTKVLKPHDGVESLYLYYGLRSIPLAGKGYARHFRFLKEASLPDLGEDEQRQLATHLQEVESKVSQLLGAYEAKLNDIDDLRQSLLQKAFAGELI